MNLRSLAAACAALLAAPALAASPIDLDFATTPSAEYWTASTMGTGPKAEFQPGSFDMTLPPSSQNDPSTGTFNAALSSSCKLQGDFDVVASYKLVKWPTSNGVRLGMIVGGSWSVGAVERTSFGINGDYWWCPREVYLTHMSTGVDVEMSGTTDTAGAIRFVRNGNELTGSYAKKDGTWQVIHSGYIESDDLSVTLAAWSHDGTFDSSLAAAVKAAFTRFEVRSGTVVCPPAN